MDEEISDAGIGETPETQADGQDAEERAAEQEAQTLSAAERGRILAYEDLISLSGSELRAMAVARGIDWTGVKYADLAEEILAHDEAQNEADPQSETAEDIDYHAADPVPPKDDAFGRSKLQLTAKELALCAAAIAAPHGSAESPADLPGRVAHKVSENQVRYSKPWPGGNGTFNYLITLPEGVAVKAEAI